MPTKMHSGRTSSLGLIDAGGVSRAWERHQRGAIDSPDLDPGVRSAIHQSWVRSSAAGIDPGCGEAPSGDVAGLQRANRELCRAARGSLDKIGQMLHGAEAMLILTDHDGLVIEAIGDPKTLEAGRRINLHVGGMWHEDAVGTNGIGTALFAGEPMFVHGCEHFVETLKDWSCAAAPIRDPVDRSIIGAVDLSGLTKIFRHHNTAFAAAAAGEIQAALGQALNEERIGLLAALIEQGPTIGTDDGVLILDRSGRVLHRSGFERLILDDGSEVVTRLGHRLAPLSGEPTVEDIASALPRTLKCRGVSNILIDGAVRGHALVLDCGRRRRTTTPAPARRGVRPGSAATIISESPSMLAAIDLARRVARVTAPVLVQGETGTGKELFARLIHAENASGSHAPFIAINCGGISRELFGGELFGHAEGAFTGALKNGKAGKLEQAHGGVFCLDEIGEMPLEIQPYLLRVLEERVVYRIGDSRARPFDARMVALTNRDLLAEAEAGRFRSDLYYRIGAVTVRVPPLRERGDDVLLLLEHFNRALAAEFGLALLRFSDEVREQCLRHRWPGNVRELRNLVQRLHSVSRDRHVTLADLPPEISLEDRAPAPLRAPVGDTEHAEKTAILRAIDEHEGNLSKVADAMGVARPTLYRKLRLYNIQRVFR